MIVKNEVLDMIRRGISLNKIKESTGIGKSTLYYHYKKIKGKKFIDVKIKESNLDKLGEFLGIFTGDGGFYFDKKRCKYIIRIYLGLYEVGYRKYLNKFLTNFFEKQPRIYGRMSNGVEITEYYSKDIYQLLRKHLVWENNKTKTIRLKSLDDKNQEFLIGFLRGIFDTDGGINKKKNKTAFGTASKQLAYQIKTILERLDLKPGFYKYKYKDFWYIDLYGERTDKFMKLVKPNNPNKIINRAPLVYR